MSNFNKFIESIRKDYITRINNYFRYNEQIKNKNEYFTLPLTGKKNIQSISNALKNNIFKLNNNISQRVGNFYGKKEKNIKYDLLNKLYNKLSSQDDLSSNQSNKIKNAINLLTNKKNSFDYNNSEVTSLIHKKLLNKDLNLSLLDGLIQKKYISPKDIGDLQNNINYQYINKVRKKTINDVLNLKKTWNNDYYHKSSLSKLIKNYYEDTLFNKHFLYDDDLLKNYIKKSGLDNENYNNYADYNNINYLPDDYSIFLDPFLNERLLENSINNSSQGKSSFLNLLANYHNKEIKNQNLSILKNGIQPYIHDKEKFNKFLAYNPLRAIEEYLKDPINFNNKLSNKSILNKSEFNNNLFKEKNNINIHNNKDPLKISQLHLIDDREFNESDLEKIRETLRNLRKNSLDKSYKGSYIHSYLMPEKFQNSLNELYPNSFLSIAFNNPENVKGYFSNVNLQEPSLNNSLNNNNIDQNKRELHSDIDNISDALTEYTPDNISDVSKIKNIKINNSLNDELIQLNDYGDNISNYSNDNNTIVNKRIEAPRLKLDLENENPTNQPANKYQVIKDENGNLKQVRVEEEEVRLDPLFNVKQEKSYNIDKNSKINKSPVKKEVKESFKSFKDKYNPESNILNNNNQNIDLDIEELHSLNNKSNSAKLDLNKLDEKTPLFNEPESIDTLIPNSSIEEERLSNAYKIEDFNDAPIMEDVSMQNKGLISLEELEQLDNEDPIFNEILRKRIKPKSENELKESIKTPKVPSKPKGLINTKNLSNAEKLAKAEQLASSQSNLLKGFKNVSRWTMIPLALDLIRTASNYKADMKKQMLEKGIVSGFIEANKNLGKHVVYETASQRDSVSDNDPLYDFLSEEEKKEYKEKREKKDKNFFEKFTSPNWVEAYELEDPYDTRKQYDSEGPVDDFKNAFKQVLDNEVGFLPTGMEVFEKKHEYYKYNNRYDKIMKNPEGQKINLNEDLNLKLNNNVLLKGKQSPNALTLDPANATTEEQNNKSTSKGVRHEHERSDSGAESTAKGARNAIIVKIISSAINASTDNPFSNESKDVLKSSPGLLKETFDELKKMYDDGRISNEQYINSFNQLKKEESGEEENQKKEIQQENKSSMPSDIIESSEPKNNTSNIHANSVPRLNNNKSIIDYTGQDINSNLPAIYPLKIEENEQVGSFDNNVLALNNNVNIHELQKPLFNFFENSKMLESLSGLLSKKYKKPILTNDENNNIYEGFSKSNKKINKNISPLRQSMQPNQGSMFNLTPS